VSPYLLAKLAAPKGTRILRRPRVLSSIDRALRAGACWVAAPAGYGKTHAVLDYLERARGPHVWYRIDEGDQDIASFFHYMALSAPRARGRATLPAFGPEYADQPLQFARRFFRAYLARLRRGTVLVLDDVHNADAADFRATLAVLLSELPQTIRPDVVMRIAMLDGVQPSALTELDDIMEKQFAGKSSGKRSALGGAKAAADIINGLDPSDEQPLMESISKSDEALGARIQDLIFVFDNLMDVDDRGMQELLRQVPSDKLLIAMKGAEETLKAKIFKNMSQRAAEMLKDDLEAKGPVKLSEVEAAQKEIVAQARKLAEDGTIALGGKGEEYV